MGTKKASKATTRKNGKKLTVSKSTLRDLSPKTSAQRMLAGGKGIRTRLYYEC